MKTVKQAKATGRRRFAVLSGVAGALLLVFGALEVQATVDLTLTADTYPTDGGEWLAHLDLATNPASIPLYAVELALSFDDDVISILDVTAAPGTGGWGAPVWSVTQGLLRIAHAGAGPIVGPTSLYKISMAGVVNAPASAGTDIQFTAIVLNDGSPEAAGTGDTATISSTPVYVRSVRITPETAEVQAGGTVSFGATVETNGDPSVDWSFGESVQLGQILSSGLYVAPTAIAGEQVVVIRATSRLSPQEYAEAVLTLLPPAGAIEAELWVTSNPANNRLVEIYASVGTEAGAVVQIQADGVTLETTAIGAPVFAHRATFRAAATTQAATITADIDGESISRTINF